MDEADYKASSARRIFGALSIEEKYRRIREYTDE